MLRILLAALILVAFPIFFLQADEAADEHSIPTAAKAALDQAETFELYSLDPAKELPPEQGFHGWSILGKTTVTGEARKALIKAFAAGVAEYKESGARCFIPRHGIRVAAGGKTVDFVICFECAHVYAHVGDAKQHFLVSESPAALFNKTLTDAGVALPDQSK